jgi:energy-coupling factor transport system permease protein
MTYRSRASPLHAARAAAGLAWCAALCASALIADSPLVLGAVAVAVLLGAWSAGVLLELRRVLWLALPLALTIVLINALVTRNGLTIIWRFGNLPLLGETNVTLEATVYGAVLGLRAAILLLCAALYSLAVDPDDVLRLFRRVSFRSALSATIATRMVPVLLRDSRRLADAQRCRPGRPPGRLTLMRATTSGVLDRALDIAATLEVRGYGATRPTGRRPARRESLSRHDEAFFGSALVVTVLSIVSRLPGVAPFGAYPALRAPLGAGAWGLSAALLICAVVPFADRRGIES